MVAEIAFHLFGPVLRFRGEVVVGVVSLSDPTEQHSHYAWKNPKQKYRFILPQHHPKHTELYFTGGLEIN